MKRTLFLLICIALLVSLAQITWAQDKQRVKLKHIAGEVAAYDNSIKTMTVRGKRIEILITLDDKTSIKAKRESRSASDIKVGDMVAVKYIESEGRNIARIIEIEIENAEKK